MPARKLDPLKIRERLYRQISIVLDQLESKKCDLSIRERIAALALLIRYDFGQKGDDDEREDAGSAVREYASAFRANAARRRASRAGDAAADDLIGDGGGGDPKGDPAA